VKDNWILFHSRAPEFACFEIGAIRADGSEFHYPTFDVPGQSSWSPVLPFGDGRRVVLVSVDDEMTHLNRSRSRLWMYDIERETLQEMGTKGLPAPYSPPVAFLPGGDRLLVNPVINDKHCMVTMNLDGSDQFTVTRPEDGYCYCGSISPDGKQLVFHVAEAPNYHIVVINIDGTNRRTIAVHPDHLYFAPKWSPDGEWILFLDCPVRIVPENFAADLCIARPDGSEMRIVTGEHPHWLAAAYGNQESRASGSNLVYWSPKSPVCAYSPMEPGSRTAWRAKKHVEFDDHFNRDYVPDEARGGCRICLLNPFSGELTPLTPLAERVWDFRTSWSRDGKRLVFLRARIGEAPELWVMNADGSEAKRLSRGRLDLGADHPFWL